MALVEILRQEAERMYTVTETLIRRVEPNMLDWKPGTGQNWMTVGQLLKHCTTACGAGIKAFLTGDWGLPEGVRFEDLPAEEMLPPASKLPAVSSVDEALRLLAEDRQLALRYLEEANEAELLTRRSSAPWGGPQLTLFQHLLSMVTHLGQHKGQLFYYLKLMGHDIKTPDLWGS
jgi:uncharacterized damage-inducible protein DinB